MNCYTTQKVASFPALEYDGAFSEYALIKQGVQMAELKMLLGTVFFDKHPNMKLRDAGGLLFLKSLPKEELAEHILAL